MSDNIVQMDGRRRGSNNGQDGGDGGDMYKDLEKRVEKLENHISEMKVDLAKLVVRSENFASKADLIEQNSSYKSEAQVLRTEMHQSLAGLHKEISNQTKWIGGTMIAVVAGAMTFMKLFLFHT